MFQLASVSLVHEPPPQLAAHSALPQSPWVGRHSLLQSVTPPGHSWPTPAAQVLRPVSVEVSQDCELQSLLLSQGESSEPSPQLELVRPP
jgi:hypothetical protein